MPPRHFGGSRVRQPPQRLRRVSEREGAVRRSDPVVRKGHAGQALRESGLPSPEPRPSLRAQGTVGAGHRMLQESARAEPELCAGETRAGTAHQHVELKNVSLVFLVSLVCLVKTNQYQNPGRNFSTRHTPKTRKTRQTR